MCYKGKCLYCIPVKPACLVLAIINAVFNGLVVMWYVFILGFNSVFKHSEPPESICGNRFKRDVFVNRMFNRDMWMEIVIIWSCFVLPAIALLNVIFSGLLCNGICKGRPKQVKAYFWYGVMVTLLLAIPLVVLSVDSDNPHFMFSETNRAIGCIWLLGCVLHTLFLVLVHQTHKKVVEDTVSKSARLGENCEFSDKKNLIKV